MVVIKKDPNKNYFVCLECVAMLFFHQLPKTDVIT